LHRLHQGSRVVGTKQTLKALRKNRVRKLFVAEDAQQEHVKPLIGLAEGLDVPVIYVPTMTELGKACEVEVKTATAALLVNDGPETMK